MEIQTNIYTTVRRIKNTEKDNHIPLRFIDNEKEQMFLNTIKQQHRLPSIQQNNIFSINNKY